MACEVQRAADARSASGRGLGCVCGYAGENSEALGMPTFALVARGTLWEICASARHWPGRRVDGGASVESAGRAERRALEPPR